MADDALVGIIDVLTDEQRRDLEALGIPVRYPANHTIFWEGQPSHSALLIQKGNVKVTQDAADGDEVILAIRGEGVMGDEGVLMDVPRSATITSITEVVGLDIKAEDLVEFVSKHNLWPVMYRAAVQRRRQSDQRALLARLNVKRRLTRWLLDLVHEVGEEVEGGWAIETTLSQQNIAARIGASRDAVAIEFRKLRQRNLVTTARGRIVLHDLDELERIASSTQSGPTAKDDGG
jgi:CRP/FNR family cyclic AMP-dependent transcriptional regulator